MLLPVVVAITLLAAITFMLSYQGVSQGNVVDGELQRDRLRFVAEAGLAHAKAELAKNTSCESYASIPETNFGSDAYSVLVTPDNGSPVSIQSSVTLANGKTLDLFANAVAAYEVPSTVVLQLDATTGRDTFLEDSFPDRNYGASDSYKIESAGVNWRPLIRFDLDAIPTGVQIHSATLQLRQFNINAPGQVFVHRLTRDWVEGTKNGGGAGDGASWNTYDGTNAWTTPGGDFDSTVYGMGSLSSSNVQPTLDIAPLVQEWVSGRAPNYGMILVADSNVRNAGLAASGTNNPPDRPQLTISYACECGKECGAAPPAGKNVLLVVGDPANLTPQDTAKQALIEGWGHTVTMINDGSTQAEFDAAVAMNDVAYISEEIISSTLDTKLRGASIGVVIEEQKLPQEFGISSSDTVFTESSIEITDNSHYITQSFSLGPVAFANSTQPVGGYDGTLAPDLRTLAVRPSTSVGTIVVIEAGGALYDSGTAAGRRVKLPWGDGGFDINALTADGETIMKRAIEWGAGEGGVSATGPIAHWKFDEGSGTLAADSAGSHDGTVTGATFTAGQLNDALSFDTGSERVEVADDPALSLTEAFTFTAWINKTGMSDWDSILHKGSWSGENYFFGTENDELHLSLGGSAEWTTTGVNLTTGTWYHVAATFDNSSDAVVLYVNGAEVLAVTTTATPATNTNPLWIGDGNTFNETSWEGLLDDVRIYATALTAAEIADLAADSAPTGPVARWKFDDGSGTVAADSAGGNDGMLQNGPTWTTGSVNGALSFDGIDDFVDMSAHAATFDGLTEGTISAWINQTTAGGGQAILQFADTNDAESYVGLRVTASEQVKFTVRENGGVLLNMDSVVSLAEGEWRHVAVTVGPGGNTLYIDGTVAAVTYLAGSATSAEFLDDVSNLNYAAIAQEKDNAGPARWFNGLIDDVRIYDRVLSASDIADLATPTAGGPIAHWKLDETSGTTAVDSVGGNDGQLNGSAAWTIGAINGGLAVDYTNGEDYIKVNNTADLENVQEGDYTLSAWFRPDSTPPGTNGDNDANYGILIKPGWHTGLFFDNQNRFGFWQHLDGDINIASTSGNTFSPGNFYHVAATVDRAAGLQSLYVNGLLEDTSGFTPGAAAREYGTGTWRIGIANPGTTSWGWAADGALDDVRIYDRVLTATEISGLATPSGGGGGGSGSGTCDGTFRDNFDTRAWNGSNGSLNWSTDWLEVGESDGATSGDIQVMNDQSNYQVRIRDNDNGGEGIEREVDLGGATTANLSYDYRRMNLDNVNDYVSVQISTNGASGPWVEVARHDGSGNDSNYQPSSHDISAFIATTTRVRFVTGPQTGGTDTVWFDNIEIQCVR